MSFGKFLDPKNDFAFKRIFGTERNKDILIHFLNDILGFKDKEQIKTVSFVPTAQDPEIAAKKQSLIDVFCVDEQGHQYIVEMQVVRTRGFEKRAQYYAAKAYSRQLNRKGKYHKLKKIIFLAITDFTMFPKKTACKSDHVILDKETYSHDLKDFYFSFLELPKFKKTIDELETIVEKWAYFFKHAEETNERELKKMIGKDHVIERAYEELNRFFWTEIELNTYEQEEKRERDAQAILDQQALDLKAAKADIQAAKADIQAAKAAAEAEIETTKATAEAEIETTKAKYVEQGIKKVAKSMKQMGVPVKQIAQYTGLSETEINAL